MKLDVESIVWIIMGLFILFVFIITSIIKCKGKTGDAQYYINNCDNPGAPDYVAGEEDEEE